MSLHRTASTALALLLAGVGAGCSSAGPRGTPAPTAPPATTAPASTAPSGAGVAGVTARAPCVGATPPARLSHVVWIIMENRGLDQIDGSRSAPYLNSLGRACGLAVDYSGVAHPSLPNYIALTSGSTQGIADDSGPASHPISAPSIFSLLGPGWRSLEESMPSNCDQHRGGDYAVKHNPAAYYTNVAAACRAQDVRLGPVPDLSARFTLITPNLCHDMHDCSTAAGDRWLASEVPQILDSPEYRAGSTALFITWDENDSGGSRVATYAIAPSVPPGTRSTAAFDHYSLLRTTEELLGLSPLLGRAATAASMTTAFHLQSRSSTLSP